jgi:hypothetical protein
MNWPRGAKLNWGQIVSKPAWLSVFDGTWASLTGIPARVFGNPTPTLNAAAQLSATRDCMVSYPVDISVSSLLLGSAQGTVTLQYADNAGMTTNLVSLMSGTNSTGGVLNIINIGTATLAGIVPAGKFRRLLTTVNGGTASFTARQGQEVLL